MGLDGDVSIYDMSVIEGRMDTKVKRCKCVAGCSETRSTTRMKRLRCLLADSHRSGANRRRDRQELAEMVFCFFPGTDEAAMVTPK